MYVQGVRRIEPRYNMPMFTRGGHGVDNPESVYFLVSRSIGILEMLPDNQIRSSLRSFKAFPTDILHVMH
jgi:hypothetical protein